MEPPTPTALRLGALCALLAVAAPGLAGPPFATDDPEPVEYRHSEFYVALENTKTEDGWTGAAPFVEYNYGEAPGLHLHVGMPLAFSAPTEGTSHLGPGDAELGAKYRFLDESGSVPMMAVYPTVFAPTGKASEGLGSGAYQAFLPLWLEKNWGSWQVNTGAGYWMDFAASAQNHWFEGVQAQKDLSSSLTLGGEIIHDAGKAPWEGRSMGFNLGLVCNVTGNDHVLFSAGRGLTQVAATNEFSSYLAYQRTW
jgi:hypothetical protein